MIQTHASWVFIAPPFAFKIKKPVGYGFLDFTTLELRHADCQRELLLNRRLAPDIYLSVEAIHELHGELTLSGEGEVFEWLVKMRQMDSRFFMSHLIRESTVTAREVDRVIALLRTFYAETPPLAPEKAQAAGRRSRKSVHDNYELLRPFRDAPLSRHALDAIERFSTEFEDRHEALFAARVDQGCFRDCHGDLHLEHIHLDPESVSIYDCIEFNEAFRHIDVISDIAFLAMDLDFNERRDLSTHFIQQFSQEWRDEKVLALLDYYKCYRACVRAKVACLRSVSDTLSPEEKEDTLSLAKRYLTLALRYALAGSKPQVFVFMGRVASGKSSLAGRLSRETGWDVLSSDVVRKTQAGVPLHYRGTAAERAGLYDPALTAATYELLCQQALDALQSGRCVILDATFSRREHRTRLAEAMQRAGHPLGWLVAQASTAQTLERLKQREEQPVVISDARQEDFDALSGSFEEPDELALSVRTVLSTDGEPDSIFAELLRCLAVRQASGGVFPREIR